jgi:hypothetical protein
MGILYRRDVDIAWMPLVIAGCIGSVFTTSFFGILFYFRERIFGNFLTAVNGDNWPTDIPRPKNGINAQWSAVAATRVALPEKIILIRHGESEANADKVSSRTFVV